MGSNSNSATKVAHQFSATSDNLNVDSSMMRTGDLLKVDT